MADLPTAVYTAYRGYEWSCLPRGVSSEERDDLYRRAAALRPEFPSADDVRQGVVSNGRVAAAFRVWSVPGWDADGRAADYFAFAYFPVLGAVEDKDVSRLLEDPFFHIPERSPPESIPWYGADAPPSSREVAAAKSAPVDSRFSELLSRYVKRGRRIDLLEASAGEYKKRWMWESRKCRWWMIAFFLLFLFTGVLSWLTRA
jgi:hypothetical protein